MNEPIYFSKIEFCECIGYRLHSIILINLAEDSLAYQTYDRGKSNKAPAIIGNGQEEFMGHTFDYEIKKTGIRMKNAKTGFEYIMLKDEGREDDVVFSHMHHFSETEKQELLSYCNALEFEPYRNREMSMSAEGYLGYRDEAEVSFVGITDSYIPMIKLPMYYYYDEGHIWPSEKLYRYILRKYLSDKKIKNWVTPYGGFSLMIE